MMAHFVGPEEEANAVEQFLSDHIKRVIDGPQVLRNGVEQASFVGSRLVATSEPKGEIETSTAERKSLIPATLGGSAAAGLVIGLVSALFLVRRRRRRADQRSEFIPEIPVDNKVVTKPAEPTQSESDRPEFDAENPATTKNETPDAELPSTDEPHLATIATARTASETIDGSHDVPHESAPTAATPNDINTRELPSEISIKPREEENASSPGSSKPPIPMVPKPPSSPTTAALLSKPPPAPKPAVARTPTPPPGTLKKKRRRKKKKKNKKAVLVRVNSRESMREMETITEAAEEEVVEDNTSEYSWYSTSDSCCSVGSRSRDPSPSPMDMSGETIETNGSQDLGSFDTGDEEEEVIVDHQDLKPAPSHEELSTEDEQQAATTTEEHESTEQPVSRDIPSAAATEETPELPHNESIEVSRDIPSAAASDETPELPHNESIEVSQDGDDDDVYIQEPTTTTIPPDSETVTTGEGSVSRATHDGDETVTTGDGSSTISSSRATNDDTEGSTMPPVPTHWV